MSLNFEILLKFSKSSTRELNLSLLDKNPKSRTFFQKGLLEFVSYFNLKIIHSLPAACRQSFKVTIAALRT